MTSPSHNPLNRKQTDEIQMMTSSSHKPLDRKQTDDIEVAISSTSVHHQAVKSHNSLTISGHKGPKEAIGCRWCCPTPVVCILIVVIWCFLTIICIILLPFLMVAFLVTPLLQFILKGDEYYKVTIVKDYLRLLITLTMLIILGSLGIFSMILLGFPRSKHVIFVGLSITKWIHTYCVIFGLFYLNYIISICLMALVVPLLWLNPEKRRIHVYNGLLEIIDCLICLWMVSEVMTHVPAFKTHTILNLYTHKWIEVSLFIIIACNVIILSTHTILWILRKFLREKLDQDSDSNQPTICDAIAELFNKKYLLYYANGMKLSIDFFFSSLLLLVVWVWYFGSCLGETHRSRYVKEFGTWTCVSLLICSILWVIKTCVLLSWEASSVYERLDSKILDGGNQLYFLGVISRDSYDSFNLLHMETYYGWFGDLLIKTFGYSTGTPFVSCVRRFMRKKKYAHNDDTLSYFSKKQKVRED